MEQHNCIIREAEEKERAEREAQVALKSRKSLFPKWTVEGVTNEAIECLNIHWIEPVASIELENTVDSQFDMPLTMKAFLFQCFEPIANTAPSNGKVNKSLMEFYLKHGKPQYETWSAQKITTVKVVGSVDTESFINVKFKKARGSQSVIHKFTLTDLTGLNPYDWIIMFHFLLNDEKSYEPIFEHVKRMLASYVNEVAKLDMEITTTLKKKQIVLPRGAASDINKIQIRKIDKTNWTMMFHHGYVECDVR